MTSIGKPSAAPPGAGIRAALRATRNVLVATARTADGCRPRSRSPKRARQASAARRVAAVRRPAGSRPAPTRRFSRHVSSRKIWSPSTRPSSRRKLFEPEVDHGERRGHAAGEGMGGSRTARRHCDAARRDGPCATLPRLRGAADARRLPAEDPHRARLRRRHRVAARARRRRCRSGSATACCSSARTSSRCSPSSCAARTTRWRI